MPNFIDRRLNPKDKSLGNRQRFLRRAREELKRADPRCRSAAARSPTSTPSTRSASRRRAPASRRFQHAPSSGRRDHVLPGNKEFAPGDRHRASPVRAAAAAARTPPTRAKARTISSFVLSREEVLDMFFEDLELPDHGQAQPEGEPTLFKPRRAGFTTTGSPTNINVGRTMRNSYGRRIALQRPKRDEIEAIAEETRTARGGDRPIPSTQRAGELRCARNCERLQRRRRRIAYVDPVDIRFNRFERAARAERQGGDVLPDGRLRLDGRAREGPRQALLRAAAPVPEAALRADRHRLHPPHPRGAGSGRGDVLLLARRPAARSSRPRSRRCCEIIARALSQPANGTSMPRRPPTATTASGDCAALRRAARPASIMRLCQYYAYVEIIDERETEIFAHNRERHLAVARLSHGRRRTWPNFQMNRIAKPADIYPGVPRTLRQAGDGERI